MGSEVAVYMPKGEKNTLAKMTFHLKMIKTFHHVNVSFNGCRSVTIHKSS